MSYSGSSIQIPVTGGMNLSYNIEAIPSGSLACSQNINIHNGGYEPRGGTAKYNSTVITNNPRVMGGFHYLVGATNEIVVYTARGGANKDILYTVGATGVDKTLYTTSTGITKIPSFVLYSYKLYMTNGYDTVQVYSGGLTTAALAAPHGDWSASDQPIQFIKHGAGNSERLWAVGTTGTPGFIYYSTDNDGSSEASFTGTGSGRFYIDTGDKFGLVGACEYQDRLMVFGKNTTYVIDDSDATIANWGYSQAGWKGGASNHRLIIVTPNDVLAMMDDGDIYSVTAVQSYGDYKAASIARPAGIDTWIRDNIDLTYISSFHAIYDPNLKAVKWFMVRKDQTHVDTCLVYYIDRPPDKAWTLHNNTTSNINGYNASCSFNFKGADNKDNIYTGDWGGTGKGWVWKTEQTAYSDNSTAYEVKLRTPRMSLGGDQDPTAVRINKKFKELRLIDQNFLGTTGFLVKYYIDGVLHGMSYSFSEPAHGFLLGTSVLDVDSLSSDKSEFYEYTVPIGDVGKRIEIEISNNNTAGNYFFIASMLLDYKLLTMRP
jgi:hypothetical protein